MQRVWTILATSFAASAAMAQVTTLFSIPVADIKGVREVEIGHYVSGNERKIDPRYYHYSYMVVGVHERVEVAASTDYLGTNLWGFKVKAIDDPKGQYALSGGFLGIRGRESTPFIVGRYNFGDIRAHFGWQRDDRHRLLLGVDFPLGGTLSGGIDHMSSDGGATWGVLFWGVPQVPGLTLSAALGIPNNKDDGVQHSFGAFMGFRF